MTNCVTYAEYGPCYPSAHKTSHLQTSPATSHKLYPKLDKTNTELRGDKNIINNKTKTALFIFNSYDFSSGLTTSRVGAQKCCCLLKYMLINLNTSV